MGEISLEKSFLPLALESCKYHEIQIIEKYLDLNSVLFIITLK